jgi:hypothetical protein
MHSKWFLPFLFSVNSPETPGYFLRDGRKLLPTSKVVKLTSPTGEVHPWVLYPDFGFLCLALFIASLRIKSFWFLRASSLTISLILGL